MSSRRYIAQPAFTIQLFAAVGVQSYGFKFPTLRKAQKAAQLIGRGKKFAWGFATGYRILDSRGVVVAEAQIRRSERCACS